MGYENRGRGNFDRGPREEFDAVCSECKKDCKVPFKPDPSKEVFCRECFAKRRPKRY
jgi:CxxC-x17-CxxC domain-containing protein